MKRRHHWVAMAVLVLGSTQASLAQEAQEGPAYGWKKDVTGALNLTQVSFSNWAQGGESSVAWQLIVDNRFVNNQERHKLTLSARFSFGKTKLGDNEFRKSIDKIKMEAVWAYKLGTWINPYAALTALSQFAAGYKYPNEDTRVQVSAFLDPGYFTQSVGFGIEPAKGFKSRAGLSLKETVTRDFPVPYADDPATPEIEKARVEIGAESTTDLARNLAENISLTSKLELFSNLQAFDEIDVSWDSLIAAKVSRFLNVSFNLRIFYDKDISSKRQINQSLAVGLTYRFL